MITPLVFSNTSYICLKFKSKSNCGLKFYIFTFYSNYIFKFQESNSPYPTYLSIRICQPHCSHFDYIVVPLNDYNIGI